MPRSKSSLQKASSHLRMLFERNGYVRLPRPEARQRSRRDYRKGYEVRLVLASRDEVASAQAALHVVGLKAGESWPKHSRIVLPVYGKAAIEWFAPERLNSED